MCFSRQKRAYDIAGTGPTRRQRCHRLVPYAEIRGGHVGCDLLMARRNQCDAVARFVQSIKDADIPVATESKNVWDFAFDQILGNDIATLHARHRWRPLEIACDNARAFFTISACADNAGVQRQPLSKKSSTTHSLNRRYLSEWREFFAQERLFFPRLIQFYQQFQLVARRAELVPITIPRELSLDYRI